MAAKLKECTHFVCGDVTANYSELQIYLAENFPQTTAW